MKRARVIVLSMVIAMASGSVPLYAHANRDFDDKHHSGSDDYSLLCPWCDEESGANGDEGVGGYMNYRELYDREIGKTHPRSGEPVTVDQAYTLVENYLSVSGLLDLKIGDIIEDGDEFDAEIIDKDGSRVDTLVIDRQTGEIISAH